MVADPSPSPLGWCAWHLGSEEQRGAVTVYNGAALCDGCHSAAVRQDGLHPETASEARQRLADA